RLVHFFVGLALALFAFDQGSLLGRIGFRCALIHLDRGFRRSIFGGGFVHFRGILGSSVRLGTLFVLYSRDVFIDDLVRAHLLIHHVLGRLLLSTCLAFFLGRRHSSCVILLLGLVELNLGFGFGLLALFRAFRHLGASRRCTAGESSHRKQCQQSPTH